MAELCRNEGGKTNTEQGRQRKVKRSSVSVLVMSWPRKWLMINYLRDVDSKINQQEQHAKKQVEYLQALNVFKMLLQSVHSRLESWALDDPEQCGAKVKANKSWILCLLQEGSGRRGKAIKVNCQSSLAKGTRQLNGLENVRYVSLPLDSISVRLLGKARQMFMQFNFSSKGELSRGVCVCVRVCAFALRAFLVFVY